MGSANGERLTQASVSDICSDSSTLVKQVQFSGTGGTFLGKAKDTSSVLLKLYFLMQNLGRVVWQRGGCAWKWEVVWSIVGALTKESEVIHRRKRPRQ